MPCAAAQPARVRGIGCGPCGGVPAAIPEGINVIAVLRDQVTRWRLAPEIVVAGIVLAGLSLSSSQELYTLNVIQEGTDGGGTPLPRW